jgi:hypothetical protein
MMGIILLAMIVGGIFFLTKKKLFWIFKKLRFLIPFGFFLLFYVVAWAEFLDNLIPFAIAAIVTSLIFLGLSVFGAWTIVSK